MKKNYEPKSKEWFVQRIGKRVYRDSWEEHEEWCNECRKGYEKGIVVNDQLHASYLAMIDMDFGAEGLFMNYRDKP